MHMADALLSPAAGGAMWAVSAGAISYCSFKVRRESDDRIIPLMGVLGAFLFAAQMINFSIPVTGSSGHLGGGLLLSILVGPYAALLTIASVLFVQALFFADGGLLALGCNIFNLGFIPSFIAYPLIYKRLIGTDPGRTRLTAATTISAIIGLQLGAFGVVLETVLSGVSSLPFSTFAALMQPIQLAIGIVEGLVTAAVVSFVLKARPEVFKEAPAVLPIGRRNLRSVALAFLAAAIVTGGCFSWFASKDPDGLEWAIAKATGNEGLKVPEQGIHGMMAAWQQKTALLPGYSFKATTGAKGEAPRSAAPADKDEGKVAASVSGIAGGFITLAVALLSGLLLKRRSQPA